MFLCSSMQGSPCHPAAVASAEPPLTLPPALCTDEHYFATLLAVLGKEAETECGGWGVAAQDWSKGGPHPKAFT